ncbi:hypothetical protein HA402_011962 [Bradysia odoriphaga]|nr:hypothetical protein HA402_011962 [Bradysia odoriphaga]
MRLLVLTLLSLVSWANAQNDYPEWITGTFPEDFQWGLATASYQIEGAWNVDGKGENIWDTFTHRDVSPIFDGSDGDIACDSYNRYQVDVQLLKNMGVDFYRFSVSWSRVLSTGRLSGGVNAAGINYYNNLIDDLIAIGIEPMMTIYHWDLPQALQDDNGWQNETIVNAYEEYANLLFSNFGDRIKKWITFNEPWVTCEMGHGSGDHAPGIKQPATAPYLCAHNVLRSHGRVYRLYERTYKAAQNGLVGITLDSAYYTPKNADNEEDVKAAERAVTFKHGWFAHPIFKGGDYPPIMRELIDAKSAEDNLPQSRLPVFTADEMQSISGSSDFLGFNHYTTDLVESRISSDRSWSGDQNTATSKHPDWPTSSASWLAHVPWGFRKLLNYFKDTYGNPVVYVTESGFADTENERLNDDGRVRYYREYINEMLKAITIDNCNVKAYTAWSLMDNFEWARGYSERFGVHWVNFTHPDRPRYPKKSAVELKKIFADNGFPAETSGSSKLVVGVIYAFTFAVFIFGRLF